MLNAISALSPVASQVTQGLSGLGAAITRHGLQAGQATPAAPGTDFGTVFANVAENFMDTMKQGEAAASAGIQGKAAVQDVVQAVMSAEQSLQLAMAMRDKVVSAYQEFIRMQI
jgi:flagellar hook-basal body complex protein FliE